jgi:hypothetical protein
MGLLDDAIREHLELKRLHGASDEEIAQEEAEALGPARRDFPLPPAAEEVQSAEVQSAEAEGAVEDALPEAVEPGPAELERRQALEPEPEPAVEPERATEPEPDTRHPAPDTEDPEPAEQGRDEDVLEETPEFLQDAPEHDRLWFEQKPPRDFDFE